MPSRTTTTALAAALLVATAAGTAAAAQPAADARAAAPLCRESQVKVSASTADTQPGAYPNVLHIKVTNVSAGPCAVDRIPTVTFGELDGPALPEPPGESGSYLLKPGKSGFASVRTIANPADPDARVVDHVTVAGDPAHRGTRFTADDLGIAGGVRVWEPVTTWWLSSPAKADEVLADRARV